MGKFIDNAITDAGRILLADVQMGATFTPTKIVIGSGKLPPGTTARTISAVVTPVIELAINKKERANDGTVVIGGIYSNETIREDFYFRELALFAKAVKADGSPTQEVLYSYGNAGELADLMPAYTSGSPVERQIDLVTYIGNDTKVDVTITSGMYISMREKGQPNGVATLDGNGKLDSNQLGDIDCGNWDASPLQEHNISAYTHSNIMVDGNKTSSEDTSRALDEHIVAQNAHQNIFVDGNNM